jgi:hypothetical protein
MAIKVARVWLLALAGLHSTIAAQDQAQDARADYPASYFVDFQPQNALDMLSRVPGFVLAEGNGSRGFGDAAGNVLVDGDRPATKDISLTEYLQRIPANAVERIELRDGATAGLQGGGSRLIANVILKTTDASSGTLRVRGETIGDGRFGPTGALSWQGNLGGLKISTSAEGGVDSLMILEGREQLIDSERDVIEDGPISDRRKNTYAAGSFSIAGPVAGLDATLSTSLRASKFARRSAFDVFLPAQTDRARIDLEQDDNRSRSAEVSLEIKDTIGRGQATLIALQTWSGSRGLSGITSRFPEDSFAGSRFESRQDQSETIVRAGWAPAWPNLTGELAVEAVRTQLGANTSFFSDDQTGSVLQDRGTTKVGEWRGSVAVSATYTGFDRLSIEASAAAEISRISLALPLVSANTYRFFKPRLVANWSPNKRTTASLRLERTVGQLDFGDFVGAQQVSDGSSTQTNSTLQPPQTDSLRLSLERRWSQRGSIAVTFVAEKLRNIVDVVPVDGGQGIGNIAQASAWGFDLLAALPLDFVAQGAELTLDSAWRRTSLTDPFNGQRRPVQFTEFQPTTATFRHVVSPRLTYGARASYGPESRIFRSALLSEFRPGPDISLFGEIMISSKRTTSPHNRRRKRLQILLDRVMTRFVSCWQIWFTIFAVR